MSLLNQELEYSKRTTSFFGSLIGGIRRVGLGLLCYIINASLLHQLFQIDSDLLWIGYSILLSSQL